MAEGKKIEIRIAATGGQQAAAEVRKVESAVEADTTATLRATKAKEEYSLTASKVTASSGAMGRGIQNVAFQFQDMAV